MLIEESRKESTYIKPWAKEEHIYIYIYFHVPSSTKTYKNKLYIYQALIQLILKSFGIYIITSVREAIPEIDKISYLFIGF